MGKFDLTPPRGQKQRYAIALITSCVQEDHASASQPVVKSLLMDKIQPLEAAEGPKAVLAFQRFRRLTMSLNPASTEQPKHTETMEQLATRPLKKCRTLSAMPTDESLEEPMPKPSS